MAKVKSTVRINSQRIKQLNQAAIQALKLTGEELHKDIIQEGVIPRDRGTLEDSTFVDYSNSNQGKVSIVSSTPYARRLYYNPDGFQFHQSAWQDKKGKHDGNPNAKDHWFEDWTKDGNKSDFVPKNFKKFYRKLINT